MTDFLLELRSEEIPARMQVKAKDDLARLFADEIAKAGLVAEAIETFATPRRLALIARGLPDATEAVSEERKGPRSNAPEAALAGFLRSTGLTREQLVERDGVFFAVIEKPGRATADVLAEAVPAVVRAFSWPKSMRWGHASLSTESLRWVRPLQGVVALFGEQVVPFEIDGVASGRDTSGHRFMGIVPERGLSPVAAGDNPRSGTVPISNADAYVEQLRAAHVIVHLSERTALIRDGAQRLAAAAGLTLVEDEGLVLENAGLTEWPVPLLGSFDPAFLDVPSEVIQLTARVNQKYFVLRDAGGRLAPNFICTANIDATDGGKAIVAGNERVLSARLSDAKFFWENDLKVPLEAQAEKLKDIVFHEKLGTVADKVERVAKLARWLVESGVVTGLADLAERAARLCKADLVTGMVGEFPELQGLIGGHLARAQGEDPRVADAIRDHYKPVGQGDDVPTAPVTVAVSLADKLDTIVSFFAIGEKPTGSKDPFALRRSALGLVRATLEGDLRYSLKDVLVEARHIAIEQERANQVVSLTARFLEEHEFALMKVGELEAAQDESLNHITGLWREMERASQRLPLTAVQARNLAEVYAAKEAQVTYQTVWFIVEEMQSFLADRLKVQQREAGVRHDLIDAVFALGGEDDLVRLLTRVKALQAFVGTAEGANLLAGYKRASNILKKEGIAATRVAPAEAGAALGDGAPQPHAAPASAGATSNGLSYTPEPCEADLVAALDLAEPRVGAAIDAEEFEEAMQLLSTLRTPIDAFFENVTINDPDPAKRDARLALLARVRDAVHRVADFSRIEG